MEDQQLDILDEIKQEIKNLEHALELGNNDVKWIISDIHELLDKLLLT